MCEDSILLNSKVKLHATFCSLSEPSKSGSTYSRNRWRQKRNEMPSAVLDDLDRMRCTNYVSLSTKVMMQSKPCVFFLICVIKFMETKPRRRKGIFNSLEDPRCFLLPPLTV